MNNWQVGYTCQTKFDPSNSFQYPLTVNSNHVWQCPILSVQLPVPQNIHQQSCRSNRNLKNNSHEGQIWYIVQSTLDCTWWQPTSFFWPTSFSHNPMQINGFGNFQWSHKEQGWTLAYIPLALCHQSWIALWQQHTSSSWATTFVCTPHPYQSPKACTSYSPVMFTHMSEISACWMTKESLYWRGRTCTSLMTLTAMFFAAARSSSPVCIMMESVSPYMTCHHDQIAKPSISA